MKDAIKGRRLSLVIKLEPEGEEMEHGMVDEHNEEPKEELKDMPQDLAKIAKKGSFMGGDKIEIESDEDEAHEDVGMDEKDLQLVENMINSGREPKNITERMLLEQYKKQRG